MIVSSPREITTLLQAWRQGDSSALEQLVPLVEAELHRWRTATWHKAPGSHAADDCVGQRSLSAVDGL
jgi:hypothetical protein